MRGSPKTILIPSASAWDEWRLLLLLLLSPVGTVSVITLLLVTVITPSQQKCSRGQGRAAGVRAGLMHSDYSQGPALRKPFRSPHPCFLLSCFVVCVDEEMFAEWAAGSAVQAGARSADVVALVAGPGVGEQKVSRILSSGQGSASWSIFDISLLPRVPRPAAPTSSWSWAGSSLPHSMHVSRRPTASQGTSS